MAAKMLMKQNSIRTKLFKGTFTVLLLLLILVISSITVVRILKNTTDELLVEYREMNVMIELKLSFYQLLIQSNNKNFATSIPSHELNKILLHQAQEKLEECYHVLTETHNTSRINAFQQSLNKIESLNDALFEMNPEDDREDLIYMVNKAINMTLTQIDLIISDIQVETTSYAQFSQTVFKHSSFSFLILSSLIILVFIVSGIRFIGKLTKPIYELVETTKRITEGEKGIQVKIDTGDEFSILANSFNTMLQTQEKTTVSKSYLDKILKNMFDTLIVTNSALEIKSVNKATAKLLGYPKDWFIDKPVNILFSDNDISSRESDENNLNAILKTIQRKNAFTHKSGKQIPALISCALLKSDIGESEGLIIVGHDLSERQRIEKKLEHTRKQRQIDINEAQEEERMRIATELHDGLGQILTAISYSTQEVQNLDSTDSPERDILMQKIQFQIDKAIRESKNIAYDLIPIVLKDFGLIVAIKNLIERANDLYETQFNFNSYDYAERINPKLEKSIYRICQESLNNIVKHSRAKTANYQIFMQDEIIVLVIDDDGIGFDPTTWDKPGSKGIGIMSMQERVQAFDGTISIDSKLGNGTEIIIEIPYK